MRHKYLFNWDLLTRRCSRIDVSCKPVLAIFTTGSEGQNCQNGTIHFCQHDTRDGWCQNGRMVGKDRDDEWRDQTNFVHSHLERGGYSAVSRQIRKERSSSLSILLIRAKLEKGFSLPPCPKDFLEPRLGAASRGVVAAMTGRFAGSRSLDDRRRRRLVAEADDASEGSAEPAVAPLAKRSSRTPAAKQHAVRLTSRCAS